MQGYFTLGGRRAVVEAVLRPVRGVDVDDDANAMGCACRVAQLR